MTNQEYHKGESCLFNSVLCQEGYCSGCMIYLEKIISFETTQNQIAPSMRRQDVKDLKLCTVH
jgi:hypothetical protein